MLNLKIASVEKNYFDGKAEYVIVPGHEGQMQILPNHEPIITTLTPGFIVLKHDGGEEKIKVEKGLLEHNKNSTTILL